MAQKLEMLKGVLQKVLGAGSEPTYFRIAVEDALYACTLGSEAALLNWSQNWATDDSTSLPEDDAEYQEGVQFVADEWDKILSEGNEGER